MITKQSCPKSLTYQRLISEGESPSKTLRLSWFLIVVCMCLFTVNQPEKTESNLPIETKANLKRIKIYKH